MPNVVITQSGVLSPSWRNVLVSVNSCIVCMYVYAHIISDNVSFGARTDYMDQVNVLDITVGPIRGDQPRRMFLHNQINV